MLRSLPKTQTLTQYVNRGLTRSCETQKPSHFMTSPLRHERAGPDGINTCAGQEPCPSFTPTRVRTYQSSPKVMFCNVTPPVRHIRDLDIDLKRRQSGWMYNSGMKTFTNTPQCKRSFKDFQVKKTWIFKTKLFHCELEQAFLSDSGAQPLTFSFHDSKSSVPPQSLTAPLID